MDIAFAAGSNAGTGDIAITGYNGRIGPDPNNQKLFSGARWPSAG